MEKLHVLIIDDDRDIAYFFSLALGLLGYECKIVLTAKEALVYLAASIPDLVLLDMRLGSDIGGEDILYQIRSNPRFDDTRVVVITAYPRIAEMVTNMADLVLIKPVEVEQLKTLVTRMGTFEPGLKHSPFRDPITQLFNREFFNTRLELAFDRVHRRPDFLFAVAVIQIRLLDRDIDVLDSEARMFIQRVISERLRGRLRPMDAVARFEEWQFATLYEELKKPDDINIILARLQEIMNVPIWFQDNTYQVTADFGAVVYEERFKQPEQIMDAAEKVLDEAIKKHQEAHPFAVGSKKRAEP
jgi:diguanylate cyclase (GGDEF)-like protein